MALEYEPFLEVKGPAYPPADSVGQTFRLRCEDPTCACEWEASGELTAGRWPDLYEDWKANCPACDGPGAVVS